MPGDGFNPWITLKKFFTGLALPLVVFILAYAIEFLETEEFPPEYAAYIILIIAILHALMNLVKHWNDE